jgi:Family of unknown function (DUF5996)
MSAVVPLCHNLTTVMSRTQWPALPYDAWKDTYATLHMWTQIVGKVALATAPPLNHSWAVALQVTPRGLSTRLLRAADRAFTIAFDFVDHRLVIRTVDGDLRTLELRPRPVAEFYRAVMTVLDELSIGVRIWPVSVETPLPVKLDADVADDSYDREAVYRFWRILIAVESVLTEARCGFIGKASPAHFFWGGFDLALTRFSGRPAPPRDGPAFQREAYSHEVISHGFWPGSSPVFEPAFYAYAVPEPAGLRDADVEPAGAYYQTELGEFILPYEAVRTARHPEQALRAFIDSTYDRAATLAGWDRAGLERPPLSRSSPAAP